ncbi:GNAT family N-acetyltransferase [Flavobacteriaceae bacterium SZ-1-7]|uniref:GNAT family N-acetyltransferase n=1 Tax=Tamlana sedimenti TaxID=3134126 RepID=UPI003121B75F
MLKRNQFIWNFYKESKGIIPNCLKNVRYNDVVIDNPYYEDAADKLPKVFYLSLFPTFLEPEFIDEKNYNLKKINHYGFSGSAMKVSGSDSVEAYLKTYTKRQLRVNLRRSMERLEKAYSVKYEYNYGDISDEKCNMLTNALHVMISQRFRSRIKEHVFMMEWEQNIKNLAASIREKKSSMFVVYANEKPIGIGVNRHIHNTILFSETHSFDENFIEFGLGHIDNYLLLNWAIRNNYPFVDLGAGLTSFKRSWCNSTYEMEYLIHYKKESVLAYLIAQYEIGQIHIKNTLKSLKDKLKKQK